MGGEVGRVDPRPPPPPHPVGFDYYAFSRALSDQLKESLSFEDYEYLRNLDLLHGLFQKSFHSTYVKQKTHMYLVQMTNTNLPKD